MKGGIRAPRTPGGTWAYRLDRGIGPDGSRRQEQVAGFGAREEAAAALARALVAQGGGNPKTVAGFLERVWLPAKRAEVERSTFDQYAWAVRRHIVPALGTVALRDLTPPMLQRWLVGLVGGRSAAGPTLGARSVRLIRKVLSMALGEAVERGLLGENPVRATQGPPRPETGGQAWTADEARRFLSAAAGHRLRAAFELALATSLRRGELLGLRWSDIDFEHRRVGVAQQLVVEAGRARLKSANVTGAPMVIGIRPGMVRLLVGHRRRQEEERAAAGERWHDLDLVLTTPDGGWIAPDRFAAVMDDLVGAAGVRRITSEGLRRSARVLTGTAR